MTLSIGLLLIALLAFSSLAASIIKGQQSALAQSFIQITKDRNLVIDLGNGVKTNAQLTIPALGNGPYLGILGHLFYPSSQWKTGVGPIQQHVLADLFAWLSSHNCNIAVRYHLPVNTNITTSPYSNSASHS